MSTNLKYLLVFVIILLTLSLLYNSRKIVDVTVDVQKEIMFSNISAQQMVDRFSNIFIDPIKYFVVNDENLKVTLVDKKIANKLPDYEINISYPHIDGFSNKKDEKLVNDAIINYIDSQVEFLDKTIKTDWNSPNGGGSELNTRTIIAQPVIITEDIVSIYFKMTSHVDGAPRGIFYGESFVYDVNTHTVLELSDFFNDKSLGLERVKTLSQNQLKEVGVEVESAYFDNYNDYIIGEDGVAFVHTIMGAGPTLTAVPWIELKNMLDLKGPIRLIKN